MKNFKISGMNRISKSTQKSITGGSDHLRCLNMCRIAYEPGPGLWRCWERCGGMAGS